FVDCDAGKSRLAHRDPVDAWVERDKTVQAGAARYRVLCHGGRWVQQRHLGAGHDRPARVGDRAPDAPSSRLAECGRRTERETDKKTYAQTRAQVSDYESQRFHNFLLTSGTLEWKTAFSVSAANTDSSAKA